MEITKNKNSYTVKKVDGKLRWPDRMMQYSSILPFSLYRGGKVQQRKYSLSMQMYIHTSVLQQTEMEIIKNKNSYTVKKVDGKLRQPDRMMQYSSILPFSLYREIKYSNISTHCPCKCTFILLVC
jgi:hypothetical protein